MRSAQPKSSSLRRFVLCGTGLSGLMIATFGQAQIQAFRANPASVPVLRGFIQPAHPPQFLNVQPRYLGRVAPPQFIQPALHPRPSPALDGGLWQGRAAPILILPQTLQGRHRPSLPGQQRQAHPKSYVHGARDVESGVSWPSVAPNVIGSTGIPSGSRSHFRLSVDGVDIAGDGFHEEAGQTQADIALAQADVQLRVDGLEVKPHLNVGLVTDAAHHPRRDPLEFVAYSNYDAYIARAEVRIFARLGSGANDPSQTDEIGRVDTGRPRLVVPLDLSGRGGTFIPPDLPADLLYQLRVYDAYGRYDETVPKAISLVDHPRNGYVAPGDLSFGLGVYGRDATHVRNIQVRGGAVTINGERVPPGVTPFVMGRPVPVDGNGRFVMQQILPFGAADIDVRLDNGHVGGVAFRRSVEIPDTDLFYVALGGLTIGPRGAVGLADLTDPGEDFDSVELTGRGAFYLKGRIKGDMLITAALDTGEAPIDELLSNLDDKDPRQLLRRLDANSYYPVYGDDSTLHDDAPTQGRFYVRLEKGDNTLLWGNFATAVTGTEIAQLDRGLYGALGDFNSRATTSFGERRTEATVFAADPGTVPGRDEFRGTGGSLYYLQRQDITVGSERLRLEIRNPLTGLVSETRDLRVFDDYDIDYLQGRILLSEPLQSTVSDGQIVRTGGLSGDEAHLVVRYEFSPGVTDVEGYTFGGRITQWLGNFLRFGATAQSEETGLADQTVMAADVLLRASDTTYLKGEYGQSEGPGFSEGLSTDGGFLFDDVASPGSAGLTATAYRVEGQIDLGDMGLQWRGMDARLRAAMEHQDAGYSGQGRIGYGAVDRVEAGLNASITERSTLSVEYTEQNSSERGESSSLYVDVVQKIGRGFALALGLRHSRQDPTVFTGLSPNSPRGIGKRTDATAEVRFTPSEDTTLRMFYQDTLERDTGRTAFSRFGVGGDVRVSKTLRASGEISDGDGGLGASAQLNYQGAEGSEYYVGYALSVDDTDSLSSTPREAYATYGTVTAGARRRYSDTVSIYGEEQASFGSTGRNLVHAYGVDFRPSPEWAFGASAEVGTIGDDVLGDFNREALSVSMAKTGDGLRFSTNAEARFETGVLNGRNRDRTTYLFRNTLGWDAGRDIELLGRLNVAISDSDQSSILDADFVEGVAAIAYRPVQHDRFNALAKYTFFEDLSPADQGANDFGNRRRVNSRQRSHIVAVDGLYDLTARVSLGGKLAYRLGEVELTRGSGVFVDSSAWLGVGRVDFHIIDRWDVFAEGRYLSASLSEDARLGALTGVHRHIGDNLKIGAGYSFSSFSDDLTNFRNDSDGWFINVVGKL